MESGFPCRVFSVRIFFLWLALCPGKLIRILRCDRLPERPRWLYILPAWDIPLSRKRIVFFFSFLTKLVRTSIKLSQTFRPGLMFRDKLEELYHSEASFVPTILHSNRTVLSLNTSGLFPPRTIFVLGLKRSPLRLK